jgi:hypothetical protein
MVAHAEDNLMAFGLYSLPGCRQCARPSIAMFIMISFPIGSTSFQLANTALIDRRDQPSAGG